MSQSTIPKVSLTVVSVDRRIVAKWYSTEPRSDIERIKISEQLAAAHQAVTGKGKKDVSKK